MYIKQIYVGTYVLDQTVTFKGYKRAFIKSVICKKAENKSVTFDRGLLLSVICDGQIKKKLCVYDLWICKIICLWLMILVFSVPYSVIEASGKSVICDYWFWISVICDKTTFPLLPPPPPLPQHTHTHTHKQIFNNN